MGAGAAEAGADAGTGAGALCRDGALTSTQSLSCSSTLSISAYTLDVLPNTASYTRSKKPLLPLVSTRICAAFKIWSSSLYFSAWIVFAPGSSRCCLTYFAFWPRPCKASLFDFAPSTTSIICIAAAWHKSRSMPASPAVASTFAGAATARWQFACTCVPSLSDGARALVPLLVSHCVCRLEAGNGEVDGRRDVCCPRLVRACVKISKGCSSADERSARTAPPKEGA